MSLGKDREAVALFSAAKDLSLGPSQSKVASELIMLAKSGTVELCDHNSRECLVELSFTKAAA